MNEWIGRMLGKVRIEALIARGGMAEVFLGTHLTLQRQVAVKILRNQYEDDADLLERFQREARVVAKLRHQNVVQVFDYDAIDDRPYIVMEYVQGPSLSKYLSVLHKNKERLELPAIDHILTGVANALQYAHDSGVIHRDIKPGNIILTSRSKTVTPGETLPRDFEPVLTDFGLVRFLNSSRQTSAGQTAGTPAYMSPEQARGELTDARTDIYSLGIVLYEMLTGKIPFDGETTMSILLKHITDPPPPIPGLTPTLQLVLNKALAKNKEDRFQTPVEFARAFHAATKNDTEQSTFRGITPVADTATFPAIAEPVDSLIVVKTPSTTPASTQKSLRIVILSAIAIVLAGVIYFASSGTAAFLPPEPTHTPTLTFIPTLAKSTLSPAINTIGVPAILHFRDGQAIMDQAVLEAIALPAAPEGYQYEGWLVSPDSKISLGILEVDTFGKGELVYNSPDKVNLFSIYNQVDLALKPIDSSVDSPGTVAYSYLMPPEALLYLRQLLVSAPDEPGQQSAYIHGLDADVDVLQKTTDTMLQAYASNDLSTAKKQAELVINLISGNLSADNKDWNGDALVAAIGSGYGFLLNGTNQGHIQAIYSHADYVVNSPGINQNMLTFGNQAKTCTQNLANWTDQLKSQAVTILKATTLPEADPAIQALAELVTKVSQGEDINSNLVSEAVLDECGMTTTYKVVYSMADMPLQLSAFEGTVTPSGSTTPIGLTGSPGPGTATPKTSSAGGGGNGTTPQATVAPTKVPPGQVKPTNPPKPTNEPKPTNDNGGGGGGGGGNNGGGGGGNNKP